MDRPFLGAEGLEVLEEAELEVDLASSSGSLSGDSSSPEAPSSSLPEGLRGDSALVTFLLAVPVRLKKIKMVIRG